MASDARFSRLLPRDPNLIGGCCFYEAVEVPPGYQVTIELGWGDCMAGCIKHHQWRFQIAPDGTITLAEENGDEPVDIEPGLGQGPASVTARLRAGPTCPVVQDPPQPGCEPRLVANAEAVLRAPDGSELARATSDELGEIVFSLAPGAYYVEPQPVEGLLGTAAAVAFAVGAGDVLELNLDYDTGIR